jgi:phage portal protein BeeE
LAIRVYQKKFFDRSARPDVVLESDQQISSDEAKRILIGWKEAHQGVNRAWEPAILDNGLKLNVLSLANKDMEFASLAGWAKEDIFEAYNVPPAKVGTMPMATPDMGRTVDTSFNSECIAPRLKLYEDDLTEHLLPYYADEVFFRHDNCVPRDREMDLRERESRLTSSLTCVNEERARMGLKPAPWGNGPWMPFDMIQYGEKDSPSGSSGKLGNADVDLGIPSNQPGHRRPGRRPRHSRFGRA